ncbi:PAS domain-containing sensor histidine kinase [Pseudomonas sp. TH31]|uniref:PAS domain-containing sensor histidine kinase n=1 Tax=Pseudomonas sp. TH31 TaxID=2796396 RepID=UPI001913C51E|nr:PAS domain S-box protein [Pseudomonas sp. TH31]MBK5413441.1 PAS domain S-box protein [Pseudomonas sp. TH31]MBK5417916.1 PAS domain S-box protein [Pseudomonas sp. TH31]
MIESDLGSDVLDLIHESIFLRDLDGRILYWNKASQELYGWSSTDIIGRVAHELLTSEHPDSIVCLEARVRETGRWDGELKRTTASGTQVIIEARWSIRRNCQGIPIGIVETGRDITARKATERVLTESEHRYRNLFQAMAASFWELDFTLVGVMVRGLFASGVQDLGQHFISHPELVREMMLATHVLDVNEQTVTLFGRGNKDELLGSVEPFWPESSTQVFAQSIVAAVSRKLNYVMETKLRNIDGREFDVLFTASFPPENMQKGILMVGVIDLSARNQAFAAMEQSEFRYRNLFEVMAVSFWQLDSSGLNRMFAELRTQGVSDLSAHIDEHPEFIRQAMDVCVAIDVNERTLTMYGATERSQMLGPITRFWVQGHYEAFRRSMEAAYRGEPGYLEETKTRALDGREIDVLFFVTAPPQMRAKGMVLVGNIDISELVASRVALEGMQSNLIHAARITMLGELTASIAHEVNQPLAAITTNGEAGLRWLNRPEPDVGEVRDLTVRMVADARRAADIISRIRGMACHGTSERLSLPLNNVVKEAVQFLRHELQAQNVELSLILAQHLPRICVDRTLLQQVIVNLSINAMQAMEQAQVVDRRICITTASLDATTVELVVEDNGPGIAKADLDRLFDSFFTTKKTGMGMGLPICRTVIQSHGGSIQASNNTQTRGARFTVTLPVAG